MAKECINCGKKVGFVNGEHLNGLICDECYNKFGGMLIIKLDFENDVEKYIECYNDIAQKVEEYANTNADRDKIIGGFYTLIDSRYKSRMGYSIKDFSEYEAQRKENEIKAKEKESRRVDYANSFSEFYEYDVVTIINEDHGTIDKEKMMQILSEHAKNGWKLHTMYSNELGKNAIRILGFGSNSTACEDVMIFERRIPELD